MPASTRMTIVGTLHSALRALGTWAATVHRPRLLASPLGWPALAASWTSLYVWSLGPGGRRRGMPTALSPLLNALLLSPLLWIFSLPLDIATPAPIRSGTAGAGRAATFRPRCRPGFLSGRRRLSRWWGIGSRRPRLGPWKHLLSSDLRAGALGLSVTPTAAIVAEGVNRIPSLIAAGRGWLFLY